MTHMDDPHPQQNTTVDPARNVDSQPTGKHGIDKVVPWAQVLSPVVTFGTILIAYWSLRVQNQNQQGQLEYIKTSLDRSINADVSSWTFELDKVFVQSPDLIPLFQENVRVSPGDVRYGKAVAAAEFTMDLMDALLESPYVQLNPAWHKWMTDIFSNSPIVREQLRKKSSWYDKLARTFEDWERAEEVRTGKVPD
jgi:hypothetical protein